MSANVTVGEDALDEALAPQPVSPLPKRVRFNSQVEMSDTKSADDATGSDCNSVPQAAQSFYAPI